MKNGTFLRNLRTLRTDLGIKMELQKTTEACLLVSQGTIPVQEKL